MLNNCYECEFKKSISGEEHIGCGNSDPEMRGNAHGIENGWFWYPLNFDPIWMEKECINFKEVKK